MQLIKTPSTTIRFLFQNRNIILRFARPFTCLQWKRSSPEDASFQKRCPEWKFKKKPPYRSLLMDGQKRTKISSCHTSYTISTTHALWELLCFYHLFMVCQKTGELLSLPEALPLTGSTLSPCGESRPACTFLDPIDIRFKQHLIFKNNLKQSMPGLVQAACWLVNLQKSMWLLSKKANKYQTIP